MNINKRKHDRFKFFTYLTIVAICLCLLTSHTFAQQKAKKRAEHPTDLELIAVGSVSKVIKSDMIVMDNGTYYRLSNIRVPTAYENKVKKFILSYLTGRKIGVYAQTGKKKKDLPEDGYGNPYVHVITDKGNWLQAELISRGMSWAYSSETTNALTLELKIFEDFAYNSKFGFWAHPNYAIREKDDMLDAMNSYQVFEGKVSFIKMNPEQTFYTLYFEPTENDVNNEFVVYISTTDAQRYFPKYTDYSATILGKTYRIHGWVQDDPTPSIHVTHAEQMQLIEKK